MIGREPVADRVRAGLFPEGEEANQAIRKRRRTGRVWRAVFLGSTIAAILILSILLVKIFNDTMGLVAEQSEMPESQLLLAHDPTGATESLDDLAYDDLVALYAANVSPGRCRAVEREQRFYADRFVCDDPDKVAAACASDAPPGACILDPRDESALVPVSYTHLTLPTIERCRSRWSPYH